MQRMSSVFGLSRCMLYAGGKLLEEGKQLPDLIMDEKYVLRSKTHNQVQLYLADQIMFEVAKVEDNVACDSKFLMYKQYLRQHILV